MTAESVIASIEAAEGPFRARLQAGAYGGGHDAILDLDNVLDAMHRLGAPDMRRVERVARVALSAGQNWQSIVRTMARFLLSPGTHRGY